MFCLFCCNSLIYKCIHLSIGYYFSGDGAYRSEDGHYQITGRMDDVLNVSGHRLGTAEIEDVIVSNYLHLLSRSGSLCRFIDQLKVTSTEDIS